jgi:hypothetical protein
MAEKLVSLPRPVWTFAIAGYLHPRDILSLRAADHACQAFIHSLLPDLMASFDLKAQALIASVPEEIRTRGQTEYLLLEPVRQNILSQSISKSSLAEVAAFANPPIIVLQVLNVILCLYNEELKAVQWKDVRAAIRVSGFVDSLQKKFTSSTTHTVPSNPDYKAPWFNTATIRCVSSACGSLAQMAQDYLTLQEGYQSPAVIAWIDHGFL